MKYISLQIIFLVCSIPVCSQGIDRILFLPSSADSLSIEQVAQLDSNSFTTIHNPLFFGWQNGDVWLKVKPIPLVTNNKLLLTINQPVIERITCFFPMAHGVEVVETGVSLSDKIVIPHNDHAIHIPEGILAKGEVFYVKIRSRTPLFFTLAIEESFTWASRKLTESIVLWILFGVVFTLLIYNVNLFLESNEATLVWYILYVISTLLTISILSGYIKFFGIRVSSDTVMFCGQWISSFAFFFLNQFAKAFLKINDFNKSTSLLLNIISILILLPILFSVYSPFLGQQVQFILTSAQLVFLLVVSAIQIKRGYTPANYFLAALLFSAGSIGVFYLTFVNLLPLNFMTMHSVQFGIAGESVIFAFALGFKIKALQKVNQTMLLTENAKLESRVRERTEELESINEQLEAIVERRVRELRIALFKHQSIAKDMDDFIYRSSHDVRGPLARILGIVTLDSSNNNEARLYLKMVEKECILLIDTFKKLTNYWEIKSKRQRKELFYAHREVSQIIKELTSKTKATNIQIELALPENLVIVTMTKALRIILFELLENAFVFSDESSPRVGVALQSNRNDHTLCIRNNGTRIPDQIKDDIYKRNFRGSTNSKGTGLGLFLASFAAQKMNATITQYTEDGFTVFQVVFVAKVFVSGKALK